MTKVSKGNPKRDSMSLGYTCKYQAVILELQFTKVIMLRKYSKQRA